MKQHSDQMKEFDPCAATFRATICDPYKKQQHSQKGEN